MYRIAIVEDDSAIAELIDGYIRRYASENGLEVNTVSFCNGMDFLEKYRANYDLVFMDIEMPVMDGMSAIKKLRQIDKNVLVVIVTNLAQYAVNGYELGVFDFMVKPVGYYSVAMKLSRAFETLGTISRRQIRVPSRTGKKMISADALRYVEVMRHMLVFHTAAEEVRGTGTMKKICELLEGLPFALCNQCYLVNLAYVSGIDDILKFTVDGYEVTDYVVQKANQGAWTSGWKYINIGLGSWNFSAGEHTLEIEIIGENAPSINEIRLNANSYGSWDPEDTPALHYCSQVCPDCGGCMNAECTDAACATKCSCAAEPASVNTGVALLSGINRGNIGCYLCADCDIFFTNDKMTH